MNDKDKAIANAANFINQAIQAAADVAKYLPPDITERHDLVNRLEAAAESIIPLYDKYEHARTPWQYWVLTPTKILLDLEKLGTKEDDSWIYKDPNKPLQ